MANPDTTLLTVGALKARLEEADLPDDALVLVMQEERLRNSDDDIGERYPASITASKGYGEASVLRIFLE